MYGTRDENVFYYLTAYNEPILQPAEPDGVDVDALIKGLYRYAEAPTGGGPTAQILASGSALPWAVRAQALLTDTWGVRAEVWSVTSWVELHRDGLRVDEHTLMHPSDTSQVAFVTRQLGDRSGPTIAVSDYQRAVQELIRPWVPTDYATLGTDGYGLSDTRGALRRHFRVDAESIVVRTLQALEHRGDIKPGTTQRAFDAYRLDDVSAADPGAGMGDA